jgi:hypothetical protein
MHEAAPVVITVITPAIFLASVVDVALPTETQPDRTRTHNNQPAGKLTKAAANPFPHLRPLP